MPVGPTAQYAIEKHRREALEELAIRCAQQKLLSFTKATNRTYSPSWHHAVLAQELEYVARGEVSRLMVLMPPQHGKSELASVRFPAWYIGTYPDRSIMATSYGADLAGDFGRKVRNLVMDNFFRVAFPGCQISSDSQAASKWSTHQGGHYYAIGVGGPAAGRGASLLLIDDPIKNKEEAYSKPFREMVWDWYQHTAYPRLAPTGAVVLVMTRWHCDDLGGRLMQAQARGGDRWRVVCLPAIAEEEEADRKIGEALWPARYPLEVLHRIRENIGTSAWNALYQQRPTAEEGGLLKTHWWKFYDVPLPRYEEVIQSWDMSFKGTDSSSYVVGQVWGRKGAIYHLLDQMRARIDFPQSLVAVATLSEKWPQSLAKLVEDKANGPAVIAMLKSKIPGLIAVTPEGSKEARVSAISPLVEAGNVSLPDPRVAPWVSDFLEECTAFPAGATDDCVDAMSQSLLYFQKRTQIRVSDFVLIGERETTRWDGPWGNQNQEERVFEMERQEW